MSDHAHVLQRMADETRPWVDSLTRSHYGSPILARAQANLAALEAGLHALQRVEEADATIASSN